MRNSSLTERPFSQYFISKKALRELTGETLVGTWKEDGFLHHQSMLIPIAEVQRSGATIYFNPSNMDFCTLSGGKVRHFATYNEAYKSEDW